MEAWSQAISFQVKSCTHLDCAVFVSCMYKTSKRRQAILHNKILVNGKFISNGNFLLRSKADSYAYEKLIRKWTKSVFFFRDQKHERRPSYAYGFGLLFFRQTRTGLPMRVRYSNEIAKWKWPPIFPNRRVRYARKSRRAGPVLLLYLPVKRIGGG